jgi:hypothetical protein
MKRIALTGGIATGKPRARSSSGWHCDRLRPCLRERSSQEPPSRRSFALRRCSMEEDARRARVIVFPILTRLDLNGSCTAA